MRSRGPMVIRDFVVYGYQGFCGVVFLLFSCFSSRCSRCELHFSNIFGYFEALLEYAPRIQCVRSILINLLKLCYLYDFSNGIGTHPGCFFFKKKKDMMHTNKFDIHVNPKKIKCHSIVLVKNRRIGILDLNFKK
jgi:hypothetical protein